MGLEPTNIAPTYRGGLAPRAGVRRPILPAALRAERPLARILISDDDPQIRQLYLALLPSHGFEVITAPGGDGAHTLDLARRIRPRLVISDVHKPGIDGLTLRTALRSDQRTAAIPVLLVSALDLPQRTRDQALAPFDDVLLKPFRFDELIERIAMLLALSPAEERSLSGTVLRNGSAMSYHTLTGLPGLRQMAAAVPLRTAAPGWAAASLGLRDYGALVAAHGRPRIEALVGWLGHTVLARAGSLQVGHLGFSPQATLLGDTADLAAALAAVTAAFESMRTRFMRGAAMSQHPELVIRFADDRQGLAIDIHALQRALAD